LPRGALAEFPFAGVAGAVVVCVAVVSTGVVSVVVVAVGVAGVFLCVAAFD
jgi:hypothetical protein